MKTITAKELRNNLESITARARAGEKFRVTYRSKPGFTITPDTSDRDTASPGSKKAITQFLHRVDERRANRTPFFDPHKPVKELYHEMLDTDPKYRPPYHR